MLTELAGLAALRAEFPAFRIWRDVMPDRVRYVARSRHWGLNPHTVISADLGEIREALELAGQIPAALIGSSSAQPNIARMYSFWLDGKEHYAADRAAAGALSAAFPEMAQFARANREFAARAVRHVAAQGVRQFIDAGSGLPDSPNVHEVARSVHPRARVAYVDHDPVVLAHARALLASDDRLAAVGGDVRHPGSLLTTPAICQFIDTEQPVCVLLTSVLHFFTAPVADAAVAMVRDWLPPGSYLIISAGASTSTDPALIRDLKQAYRTTAPVTGRTETEIRNWFDGFALAEPGLANIWDWRPESRPSPASARARFLAGVGRKDSVIVRRWP